MPLLTPREIRETMPQVGDKLIRRPTLGKSLGFTEQAGPQECVVTYVHPQNLWYEVQFPNGTRESYKLPDLKLGPNGGYPR